MRKSITIFASVMIGMVLAVLICSVTCAAAVTSGQDKALDNLSTSTKRVDDESFALLQIQSDLQGALNDLDFAVKESSHNLSGTGQEGVRADGVLSDLIKSNPRLTEAVTFSQDGKILDTMPMKYKSSVGADISKQEAISKIINSDDPDPIFSGFFRTVEGFDAIAIIYPVYSTTGEFIGGISATFKPAEMLKNLTAPRLNNTTYSFWIMQLDGRTVYDQDTSEIGTMLFEDPIYRPFPSLLALGKKMIAERSGHGSYSYHVAENNKTIVTKDTYWTTAGLHGSEWRLAITKIMG